MVSPSIANAEDKMEVSAATTSEESGDDRHSKFLAQVGSVLEQLLLDEKRPEHATIALKEAAGKIVSNFKGMLQLVMRKATLKLLSGISAEVDPAALQTRVGRAMLIVEYSTHMLRVLDVDVTFPASLIEYTLSCCTLPQLEAVLPMLRARLSDIGQAVSESPALPGAKSLAKLELLKAAKMCVTRDNSGTDAALSARLRIALASGLPVWDPSGANKKGLRTDLGVTFADEEAFASALKANIASRDGFPAAPVVDFVLYRTFWDLQSFIADPFTGDFPDSWPKACRAIDATVAALESTAVSKARPTTQHFAKTPRYLTSPNLLPLQFADIAWRRHVLTQFLIFLFQIRTMGEDVTEPRLGDKARWNQRKPFCHSLFKPGEDGARLQGRILKLLRKDDPGGGYAAHIMELLNAERFWLNWKLRKGCPNLEVPSAQMKEVRPLKRRRLTTADSLEIDGDAVKERIVPGKLGWTKRAKFFQITPHESVLPILLERELPEIYSREFLVDKLTQDRETEEEDMRFGNDPKFQWLALRALRMTDLKGLSKVLCDKEKFGIDLNKLIPPVPQKLDANAAKPAEAATEKGKINDMEKSSAK